MTNSEGIQVHWSLLVPDKFGRLSVRIPAVDGEAYGCLFGHSGDAEIHLLGIDVGSRFQRQGYGARMLGRFVDEARMADAILFSATATSESGLRTIARVLGKDNLSFYGLDLGSRLELTYQEALDSGLSYFVRAKIA